MKTYNSRVEAGKITELGRNARGSFVRTEDGELHEYATTALSPEKLDIGSFFVRYPDGTHGFMIGGEFTHLYTEEPTP